MPLDVKPSVKTSSVQVSPAQSEAAKKQSLVEKLAKVRVLREKMLMNRGEVKGKPDKMYCWVNVHESRRQWYEGLGWELCKDPSVHTEFKKEDGTHVRGDLILYQIDKETYELLNLDSELRGIEGIQGSKDEFLSFAESNRIPAKLQEV